MNAALIYRPSSGKLIWTAFACAIAIHLAVVALAETKSKPVLQTSGGEPVDTVIGVIDPPPQVPEPEIVPPAEPSASENQEFIEENVPPRPIPPRKKTPLAPIARTIGSGTGVTHAGLVKALTLYAPRPSYPYEARRGGITGSGVAELTVNSESGNVITARMSESTGSAILDKATVETLERWRFKPGVGPNVGVPITFTLTGVSY